MANEIIDVLTLPLRYTPSFTVDTGAASVDLTNNATGTNGVLQNAKGYRNFQAGDNIQLLTFGLWLPENFCFASQAITALGSNWGVPQFVLSLYVPATGLFHVLSGSGVGGTGNNGEISVPLENYEMPIDTFVRASYYDGTNPYSISAVLYHEAGYEKPQISMSNVPTGLNATVQRCVVFMKVAHTLPMANKVLPV